MKKEMKKGMLSAVSVFLGVFVGAAATGSASKKSFRKREEKIEKFKNYYNILNQWLIIKQEGKSLVEYFVEKNYNTIAIYGMGEMGNRLYNELKDSSIVVKYAIDNDANNVYSKIEIIDPEDDFEEVDAIIVTATFAFDRIEEKLREKTECVIISLEDVVYEV